MTQDKAPQDPDKPQKLSSFAGNPSSTMPVAFPKPSIPLIGLILAGGLSSRMGEHKPSLKVYGDNQPDMLVRTASLLKNCVDEVWLSCRMGQTVQGYTCVHDTQNGLGPMGGIHAALQALQSTHYAGMLVLSCDLPFMQAENLNLLLNTHCAAHYRPFAGSHLPPSADTPSGSVPLMTTFRQEETGFIEALVSIYHRDAYPYFHDAMDAGIRQINKVIPPHLRRDIVYQRAEALPFFNINYPADLEMARRLIQAL